MMVCCVTEAVAVPGKQLLAHDDAVFFDDTEADLGWIFRDAITGDVLPYFQHGSLCWTV